MIPSYTCYSFLLFIYKNKFGKIQQAKLPYVQIIPQLGKVLQNTKNILLHFHLICILFTPYPVYFVKQNNQKIKINIL